VENDGPYSSAGGDEDDATANVVRFPRDWFGPREELVPFGPSAEDQAGDEAEEAAPAEMVAPPPVRADDFWGEESASIHDAMQAPVAAEPGAAKPVPATEPLEAVRERAPSRFRTGALRPIWASGLRSARLGRRRGLISAGLGATAILLVVVVLGSFGLQVVHTPTGGGAVAALNPAAIGGLPPALASRQAGSRKGRTGAASRRKARGPTGGSHGRASRARIHHSGGRGSSAPSTQVASAAPAASAEPSTGVATSSGAATTTEASSDSGGGSGSSSSAGPVGAGAPFGPGHLG
jgi:hypothetical protein